MNSYRPSTLVAGQVSVVRHSSDQDLSGKAQIESEPPFRHLVATPTHNQLVGLAKALSSARCQRKAFLSDLLGEPGWDILLALFYAEGKGHRLTVSDLCVASDCPQTTALRALDRLKQLDLVGRSRSPTDGRIVYIFLKPTAGTAIESYLRKIWSTLFDQ